LYSNTAAKKHCFHDRSFVTPNARKPILKSPVAVTQPSIENKLAKHSDPSSASVDFPATLTDNNGNVVWVLLAHVKSDTSFKAGCGMKPSNEESIIIKSLMTGDTYKYNVNSSTSPCTIWRGDCTHPVCIVQIKFVRGNQCIAKYQRGFHTHLPTSEGRTSFASSASSIKSSTPPTSVLWSHSRGPSLSSSSHRPGSAAVGRLKSPNKHISNELLQYASDLEAFNFKNDINGNACYLPLTIRKAARNIKKVS
jgi:hypothetical protein